MPDAARELFGPDVDRAARYAQLLAAAGVERGLLGPRESTRIWTRHLVNCGVVADLFGPSERVVDVGSGAGLPGLVLAIRRPDLRVDLVEPMLRRVTFLHDAVDALELADRVRVVRGRAEDREVMETVGGARWVTARAVAPLDRLVRWCLPLLAPGGQLALLKGATAEDELAEHRVAVERAGGRNARVVESGRGRVVPPVPVVVIDRADSAARRQATTSGTGKGRP